MSDRNTDNNQGSSGIEQGWQAWYPNVNPNFSQLELDESPYGEPNPQTLTIFENKPRLTILDVGGGDGRYAIPLAEMGHMVTVTDVHAPSIERLKARAKGLSKGAGNIKAVEADATKVFPFPYRPFDGVFCAGFLYLMPPDIAKSVFKEIARNVKQGGLVVIEFATNRQRTDLMGNSLIGSGEYNYTREEAISLLERLYQECGIELTSLQEVPIDLAGQYRLHTDLLIACGVRKRWRRGNE